MNGIVKYGTRGKIAWITIANGKKANCLSRSMLHTMVDSLRQAEKDEAVQAIVITSEGDRTFSAGMDINEFRGLDPNSAYGLIDELGEVCETIRKHRKPVVMAIKGYCIGGAMEISIAADLRIASDSSTFIMPEIQLGIPSVLDSIVLASYVGLGLAKEMLLTGDPVDADKMYARGFLNAVTTVEDVETKAEEMANSIARNNPVVIAQQKRLFETWANTSLAVAYQDSKNEFALAFASDIPESIISQR